MHDTVEPNMEYTGQIGWHIGRGAAELFMPAYLTNMFHTGRKQRPIKFLLYPAYLPFFEVSRFH